MARTIKVGGTHFVFPNGFPQADKTKYNNDFTDVIKAKLPPLPFEIKLKVNNKQYDNIIGTPTESGFYKNGYTIKKQGKKWLVIRGYTSCNKKVVIDHTFTFKIQNGRYKLRRVSGIKNSWVSTPKGRTCNDPRMLQIQAMLGKADGWNESIKFCKDFFDETHIFRQ